MAQLLWPALSWHAYEFSISCFGWKCCYMTKLVNNLMLEFAFLLGCSMRFQVFRLYCQSEGQDSDHVMVLVQLCGGKVSGWPQGFHRAVKSNWFGPSVFVTVCDFLICSPEEGGRGGGGGVFFTPRPWISLGSLLDLHLGLENRQLPPEKPQFEEQVWYLCLPAVCCKSVAEISSVVCRVW